MFAGNKSKYPHSSDGFYHYIIKLLWEDVCSELIKYVHCNKTKSFQKHSQRATFYFVYFQEMSAVCAQGRVLYAELSSHS